MVALAKFFDWRSFGNRQARPALPKYIRELGTPDGCENPTWGKRGLRMSYR
jgi:hypothetical protein